MQEGASAYLRRQFTTLAVFVVLAFLLLFLLPGQTTGVTQDRPVGLLPRRRRLLRARSATSACGSRSRGNLRVAAAAAGVRAAATRRMRIAFRTGGIVGMFTVGLGLLGASSSC